LLNAQRVRRQLLALNAKGFALAASVVFVFVVLQVEPTPEQWRALPFITAFVGVVLVLADGYILDRHYRPIHRALAEIEAGRAPSPTVLSRAIVRALNLPLYSFLRVSLFEGPAGSLVVVTVLVLRNFYSNGGYTLWQIFMPATLILAFASPAHAVFLFFAMSRFATPLVESLSARGDILPEDRHELLSTTIRDKLLYVAIFITIVPLLFFAASILIQVHFLVAELGAAASFQRVQGLWISVFTTLLVCIGGALIMSLLVAKEISRSAAKLSQAMKEVEKGRLDAQLPITTTDEYADLFRGFNLMVGGLREEVQILEASQALMGEIHLDRLLERMISATTHLLDAERGTVFVYDRKTNELFSRFAEGLAACDFPPPPGVHEDPGQPVMREIRIAANEGIAGAVFTSGNAEKISDPYADPRFNPNVDRQTGFRTRSMLTMPICNKQGERIGVTQVLNKKGGQFTAKDEARLRAFTAQIAIALENARLFEDVLSMKNYNESILRSTSNGMMTLDEKGVVATANEATLDILRTERDAVISHPASAVFGNENAWVLAAIDEVQKTGQTQISVDADLKLDGGQTASVNLSAVPLIDFNRQSIGSMLILEDITSEKRVKSTMSRYMSKEVADQLIQSGESILVGKDQRVSILFSDIRRFTRFSEALGAKETVSMLNEYFAEMVDVIFRYGGMLDKYIGDAIMALFGAPISRPTDADSAVEAANQMIVTLRELNRRRAADGKTPIEIGVGVSTGNVIVGSIGSPKRMEYTAIGDSVNLASRLEGATKFYGAKVLLSEFTVLEMKKPALLREIDLMQVQGKEEPVAVYEALDHHDEASFPNRDEVLDAYRRGLERFKASDWVGAARLFEAALIGYELDKPSKTYLERCRRFIAEPPPADWNRVWVLTEK
jgi:adenylate cyclase